MPEKWAGVMKAACGGFCFTAYLAAKAVDAALIGAWLPAWALAVGALGFLGLSLRVWFIRPKGIE